MPQTKVFPQDQRTTIAFRAYISGTQQGTSGTGITQVGFNGVNYNYGSGYDSTTYRFTAPVKGLYSFTAWIQMLNGSSGDLAAYFYLNGVKYSRIWNGYGTYPSIGGTDQIQLNPGDYVDFRVQNRTAQTNYEMDVAHSAFFGRLVGTVE